MKRSIGVVSVTLTAAFWTILQSIPVDMARAGLLDSVKDAAKEAVGSSVGTPAKPSPSSLTMGAQLDDKEIGSGLREALRVGSERVVTQLGHKDGFNADKAIHIPLPGALKSVQSALQTVGMSGLADDLETRLNRAAEVATPEAKALFLKAIDEMTIDDARKIYQGPNDAATQYFKGKMSSPLAERMTPVVKSSLADVGAVQSYDAMMGKYKTLPLMSDVQTDLSGYVVQRGMDGIFHYLAIQEADIRTNPAARTTALLKKVFSGR